MISSFKGGLDFGVKADFYGWFEIIVPAINYEKYKKHYDSQRNFLIDKGDGYFENIFMLLDSHKLKWMIN